MTAAHASSRFFRLLAPLFACPTSAYWTQLDTCMAALGEDYPHVAEQVQRFADLLVDLSVPELVELHAHTFVEDGDTGERLAAMLEQLARSSVDAGPVYARTVLLPVLEEHLERLEEDRNPFVYLARAACCLLIGAARHASD